MDLAELTRTLQQLRAEQLRDEAELAAVQARVSSRRQAITGLTRLVDALRGTGKEPDAAQVSESVESDGTPPEESIQPELQVSESVQSEAERSSPDGQEEDHPRGVEAVRRVLVETGTTWTAKAMTEELLRRGWSPKSSSPEDAVRTALSRALKAPGNGIVRLPDGYAYRPEEDSSTGDVGSTTT